MKSLSPFVFYLIFTLSCSQPETGKQFTLIEGGTLIDVSDLGQSKKDVKPAFVLLEGTKIIDYGKWSDQIKIPEHSRIIDATGKFILPGLMDGFAVQNNQAYANAFLYMGVTSIIGVEGGRRGDFFWDADLSPDIYKLESVGEEPKTTEEHLKDLQKLHKKGIRVVLLMYALTPDQLKVLKEKAASLGMACIGELGHTSYKEGMDMGINAFVHTTRYSLDVAPPEMAKAVADEPFSDEMNSPKWKYYQYLYSLQPDNPALLQHAENLGNSSSFIIPTFSLLYLDLPKHKNPWSYPVSKILNPKDINNPADKTTGNHVYTPEVQENYTKMALQEYMIEKTYHSHGAKYLAGSACDVWGTMPGISLHTELESLKKLGLTNREVLATATSNFHKAFGWKTGKIEKDFAANILILNKNPLKDLENLTDIQHLILRGKEINRENLLK